MYKNIQKKAKLQQKPIDLSLAIRLLMEDLNVLTTVDSLQEWLNTNRGEEKLSLVPTMGALHHGHMELVRSAFSYAEIVVVSIFVNPTQFNNEQDLNRYPRTLKQDIALLKTVGNVVVFAPTVGEMYPKDFTNLDLELGNLDKVMEGACRPGHFKGVLNVVYRLFEIVRPDYGIFGVKDFQQLTIINFMNNSLDLGVTIIPCQTVREKSGLASSSRNSLLSASDLESATIIIETLEFAKKIASKHAPEKVLLMAKEHFSKGLLKLEYITIVHPDSLKEIKTWVPGSRMCIAAFCGGVRLIDNIELVDNDGFLKNE